MPHRTGMRCWLWFFHDWTAWEVIFRDPAYRIYHRECPKCGRMQEKTLFREIV